MAQDVAGHGGVGSETCCHQEPDRALLEQVRDVIADTAFGTGICDATEAEARLEHLRDCAGVAYPHLEVVEAGQKRGCRRPDHPLWVCSCEHHATI